MQAARKGRGTNETRLPTNPPSNLSTQCGCSARNNKSPIVIGIPSLESDLPADLTRGRVLILRETLLTILISDGYNITEFINECRGIQNAILPQEEASVVVYLRSKLRGEARKALHQQQFAIIEQLLNRLKKSFGIVGDIFDSYAELKKLGMGNQEKLVSYIDHQTVYNQIIEAEKSSGGALFCIYRCRNYQTK